MEPTIPAKEQDWFVKNHYLVSVCVRLSDRDKSIRNQEIVQKSMIYSYHKWQLSLDDNFFWMLKI